MNKNGGFTLVEVLVSVVLVAILGVIFFEFFVLSQKTAVSNEGKMDAVTIAQAVLEDVKNGKYPEITTDCSPGGYPKIYQNHSLTGIRACDMGIVENKDECRGRYEKNLNIGNYMVEIEVGAELEEGLGLHSIKVRIYDRDGKLRSSVRGAVKLCTGTS